MSKDYDPVMLKIRSDALDRIQDLLEPYINNYGAEPDVDLLWNLVDAAFPQAPIA